MTDPIELAVFGSVFHSIAEEMGVVLRRSAFSPNIKERRDYSSAVFDSSGRIVAMGDDMPVHLGSMPMSVRAALERLSLDDGDIAILNDPYAGGTHLPDISLVVPVFVPGKPSAAFFVANRAHHADVGGRYPGSMGPCNEIWQEGLRIPPVKLFAHGVLNKPLLDLILNNVRTPNEREGDLTGQIGACRIGLIRLLDLVVKYGFPRVDEAAHALIEYSERLLCAELAQLPEGEFSAVDHLDDNGLSEAPVKIAVTLKTIPSEGRLRVDFSASDDQIAGSLNAVSAVTYSAVSYVMRCLLPIEVAPNAGVMNSVEVITREGSVVAARLPAAVAGGNVETSQRIVDVLLLAFSQILPDRIPAASSGTMSNLTIGGVDSRTGRPYAYYETIAGGSGAYPRGDGTSGVHTHMTNSLNTPVEALEYAYPFRVLRYAYRRGSGGHGAYHGGDGLVREIELLDPAQITILSDRRVLAPYGLAGGEPGTTGRNTLSENGTESALPGKCSREVPAGSILRIETPGGGGWGRPLS